MGPYTIQIRKDPNKNNGKPLQLAGQKSTWMQITPKRKEKKSVNAIEIIISKTSCK